MQYSHYLLAIHRPAVYTGESTGSTTNTHIYPLQVTVRHWGGYNSVVGVNDRNDIHPKQLVQGAVQVAPLLLIMKIQIGD